MPNYIRILFSPQISQQSCQWLSIQINWARKASFWRPMTWLNIILLRQSVHLERHKDSQPSKLVVLSQRMSKRINSRIEPRHVEIERLLGRNKIITKRKCKCKCKSNQKENCHHFMLLTVYLRSYAPTSQIEVRYVSCDDSIEISTKLCNRACATPCPTFTIVNKRPWAGNRKSWPKSKKETTKVTWRTTGVRS